MGAQKQLGTQAASKVGHHGPDPNAILYPPTQFAMWECCPHCASTRQKITV